MKQFRNILVHALVNLGDVLLTTSAIALLREAYPQARVTMLVNPVVQGLVENNPLIDEVIVFDYRAKQKSFGKMWDMVKTLKQHHFDLSVSFDRKLRPALLCWLAGIPVRVGPDKVFDNVPSRVTWLFTDVMHITHDLENTLQAETYQEIVRQFTGLTSHAAPRMASLTEENERKAEELLAQLPAGEKCIALCVKGTFSLKTWPKEYFVEVVRRLHERYHGSFFIVGAPGDAEYADEVISAMKEKVLNFCGQTSLGDLAALLGKADLLVTVDTGATHIAATTGVPMVVMYGCTSPKRWHPYNAHARVLTTEEPCCGCKIEPEECSSWPKPNCLWHVTPEMVLGACDELLADAEDNYSKRHK